MTSSMRSESFMALRPLRFFTILASILYFKVSINLFCRFEAELAASVGPLPEEASSPRFRASKATASWFCNSSGSGSKLIYFSLGELLKFSLI